MTDRIDEIAAACQRWLNGQHSWRRPEDGGFNAAQYTVEPITEKVARAFVLVHHYSRTYPAGRLQYGMFDGDRICGVAVIGQPMHPQVTGKVFPTLGGTAAELSRFVLLDDVPANGETWLLARVFRLAAAAGLRGLVAFSDPMPRVTAGGRVLMPGHLGHIYRAQGGGRYTGRGTPRSLVLLPDGSVFSARARAKITAWDRNAIGAVRTLIQHGAPPPEWMHLWAATPADRAAWVKTALAAVGARTVRHRGNHRFAWTIGDRGARRSTPVALDALPYPTVLDAAGVTG